VDTKSHDCCDANPHSEKRSPSALGAAAHATLHCLTGCVIGEFIGLAIGVTLGISPYAMMGLSTLLAFISGFSLTIFPLMRKTNLPFKNAFAAIWLGETVSIGVMELVMNTVDYHMGGVRSGSLANLLFWKALAMAVSAGYIVAFPVNAWLISKQLKKCH
jgi:F0F1-type ATP synthase assembly protein I